MAQLKSSISNAFHPCHPITFHFHSLPQSAALCVPANKDFVLHSIKPCHCLVVVAAVRRSLLCSGVIVVAHKGLSNIEIF